MPLLFLLGHAGCGASDNTVVLVTLSGVAADTRSLLATSYLNGKREQEPAVFAGTQTRFGVRLPAGVRGQLAIDIDALGDDRCSFAAGRGEATLQGEGQIEMSIPLRMLLFRTCSLTVKKLGSGEGWISSDPPGILCGSAGDQCFFQFQQSSTVTLQPNAGTQAHFDGWSMDCRSRGPCQLFMTAPAAVSATFSLMPGQ